MKYEVRYLYKGNEYLNSSEVAEVTLLKGQNNVVLTIAPKQEIKIVSCRLSLDDKMHKGEKFFANGYQSWTLTKEIGLHEKTPRIGCLARLKKVENTYHISAYGDSRFMPYRKHYSYSLTYLRKDNDYRFYGTYNEKNGYTVFFLDKKRQLWAEKDNKGLVLDKPVELFNIFREEGNEDKVFDDYVKFLGRKITTAEPLVGYTSWYRHYENISEELIEKDLKELQEKKLPFRLFQIDDGYESHVGDWLRPKKKEFPHGMEPIIKDIQKAGYVPGIWLAPFCVNKDSVLYKEHPDWVLKDKEGHPVYMGVNWNGTYALDFHLPEVREYIHKVFDYYKSLGVKLFKLDFLYAVTLVIHEDETRGELMTKAMEWIRKELDGCLILGCGVPLFPAFFNVDYCRIGMDVGLDWDDKPYMRLLHLERVSTKNAISNITFRAPFDHRFFLNDPDVVFLTGTRMTEEQKKKLFATAKKYGSVHLTSDDFSTYTDKERALWNSILEKD